MILGELRRGTGSSGHEDRESVNVKGFHVAGNRNVTSRICKETCAANNCPDSDRERRGHNVDAGGNKGSVSPAVWSLWASPERDIVLLCAQLAIATMSIVLACHTRTIRASKGPRRLTQQIERDCADALDARLFVALSRRAGKDIILFDRELQRTASRNSGQVRTILLRTEDGNNGEKKHKDNLLKNHLFLKRHTRTR